MHILSHSQGTLAAVQSIYNDSSDSDTAETSVWSSDAGTSSDESNSDDSSYISDTDSDTSIIDSDIGSNEPLNVNLIHGTIDGCDNNYKFNFAGFARYLESIAGGNRNKDASKAIVRDVHLFFQNTPAKSRSDIDRLFNKSNLELFFQKLLSERHYKPTTLSEKIRRMKLAIKYVIHSEDSMMTNKELFVKGSRLLELLTQWCLSLSKAIALQRQQHSLTVTEQLPLVLDPQEFLDNKKVWSKMIMITAVYIYKLCSSTGST